MPLIYKLKKRFSNNGFLILVVVLLSLISFQFLATATSSAAPYVMTGYTRFKITLSSDIPNAEVVAVRSADYPGEKSRTYTLKKNGTTYESNDIRVAPNQCNESSSRGISTFTIIVYGQALASGEKPELGRQDGVPTCPGGSTVEKKITVTPYSAENSSSICGTLQYYNPVTKKNEPYGTNAQIGLNGTKAANVSPDGNGKYCFKTLPAGTYDIIGNYIKQNGGAQSVNACFARNGIQLAQGQALVIDDTYTEDSDSTCASATFNNDEDSKDNPYSSAELCNASFFNPLTWFVCPLIDGLTKAAEGLDNIITSQLSVGSSGNSSNPNQIFCDSTSTDSARKSCTSYKKAWSGFRNIALGLLFVIGLIIVISQASGLAFLDAYTVKKAVPRLAIIAIAVTLSWPLMRFFVTFTNELGYGIRWLIYQPFINEETKVRLGGGGLVVASILEAGGLLALGAFGLLSFAGTALLALLVAVVILVLRQLVVIVAIILAPIALVAYVLPNTQKIYKIWWDTFSKALLVFPIISAFIATGRVFSTIATTNADNTFGEILGFIAYFAPYFLIPYTFKFAGGILGNLAGVVNNKNKGAFDRLRNFRANKMKQNMGDMAAGKRFKSSNRLASGFNNFTEKTALVGSGRAGLGVDPRRWGSRLNQSAGRSNFDHAQEYLEKNSEMRAIAGNDDYLFAALAGDNDDSARTYLKGLKDSKGKQIYSNDAVEQGVASIRAARRGANNEVFRMAATLAAPGTGTAFASKTETRQKLDEKGNKVVDANGRPVMETVEVGGAGAMHQAINNVAHGDRLLASRMLANMRASAMNARRVDLGGGSFGEQVGALESQFATSHEEYANEELKIKFIQDASQEATTKMVRNAISGQGGGTVAGARTNSVKLMAPEMLKILQEKRDYYEQAHANAWEPGLTPEKREEANAKFDAVKADLYREFASLAGRYDAMASISPENARVFAESVMGATMIDPETNKASSVQSIIESLRREPAFQQMRREYATREIELATKPSEEQQARLG